MLKAGKILEFDFEVSTLTCEGGARKEQNPITLLSFELGKVSFITETETEIPHFNEQAMVINYDVTKHKTFLFFFQKAYSMKENKTYKNLLFFALFWILNKKNKNKTNPGREKKNP